MNLAPLLKGILAYIARREVTRIIFGRKTP